ncbi:MAG: NAD(P)/FAD-dependent oxidoreductase [Parvularculales bacterium]
MAKDSQHLDVVVIGAGVAGIYQIKRLVDMGVKALVLEADKDLGGTWYRNRYPGARFDSESYTYGYSFSKEVLNEWHWKELFSSQPENLKYLNFVTDKFDLRRHMRFNAPVKTMAWDDDTRLWTLTLEEGDTVTTRFVITSIGVLSIPVLPQFEGMDTFEGEAFHSYWWPHETTPLGGRQVGIVGTGATGIQIIADIAGKVGSLTVFQRRPNWSVPLNNAPITDADMEKIRQRFDEIFANCNQSMGGFEHLPDRRGYWDLTEEERHATWDKLYETPGFALLLANFPETYLDKQANKDLGDYVADRIRQRVKDPQVAEKLIPRDHGFGMQRLPLETNYFEAYNRDNVHLVDLSETPIERVTAKGIETSASHYDLDLIIYATGFDAITGAFDRITITGANGETLGEKWRDNPRTYIGVMTHGFPNMLMVAGPQSVSGSTNYPRAIEVGVDWITNLLTHVFDKGYTYIEARKQAEDQWVRHVIAAQKRMPFGKSKGWFTGYNTNIEGREEGKVRYHAYWGGAPRYREFLEAAVAEGYSHITMQ